jgi:hypothetical protein
MYRIGEPLSLKTKQSQKASKVLVKGSTEEVKHIGIDEKPKRGSKNLISSGAVWEVIRNGLKEESASVINSYINNSSNTFQGLDPDRFIQKAGDEMLGKLTTKDLHSKGYIKSLIPGKAIELLYPDGLSQTSFIQFTKGENARLRIGELYDSNEHSYIDSWADNLRISFEGGSKWEFSKQGHLRQPGAVSGFSGSKIMLDQTDQGEGSIETDFLSVRKRMKVYELEINKIRAVNGSLWVSDTMEIDRVEETSPTNFNLYIDTDSKYVPFKFYDIIRIQRWTPEGGRLVEGYITYVPSSAEYCRLKLKEGSDKPQVGDTMVRVGNQLLSDRRGSMYLTSNDTNAPYMDVLDGVDDYTFANKVKVRLGKLSGISDPDLGTLSGYGLYAQNAYLKGKVVAGSGLIGGWRIEQDKLVSPAGTMELNSVGNEIKLTGTGNSVYNEGRITHKQAYFSSSGDSIPGWVSGVRGNVVAHLRRNETGFSDHDDNTASAFGSAAVMGLGYNESNSFRHHPIFGGLFNSARIGNLTLGSFRTNGDYEFTRVTSRNPFTALSQEITHLFATNDASSRTQYVKLPYNDRYAGRTVYVHKMGKGKVDVRASETWENGDIWFGSRNDNTRTRRSITLGSPNHEVWMFVWTGKEWAATKMQSVWDG